MFPENVDSSDSEDEAPKVTKTTPKKRPKKKMRSDDDDDSAEWITPEKSHKIQVSPFNKGTTVLMSEEGMEGTAARALDRPQRSAVREVKYALSDSSEEENEESDFDNPVFSDTGVFSDGEGDWRSSSILRQKAYMFKLYIVSAGAQIPGGHKSWPVVS